VPRRAGPGGRLSTLFRYLLYGIPVECDRLLPLPATPEGDVHPVWRFTCCPSEVPFPPLPDAPDQFLRDEAGEFLCARYSSQGTEYVWNRGIGTFEFRYAERTVRLDLDPSADPGMLDQMIIGQVAVLVLRHLGYLTLHASAVSTESGAVAFLGFHGKGKSTMAACFMERGAELITDDVLPVRGTSSAVECLPAVPMMKLWPETLGHNLELDRELPSIVKGGAKRLFVLDGEYPFVSAPVPLHSAYLLDPFDPSEAEPEIRISLLTAREGLQMLLAHTSWRFLLGPEDAGRALPLYARLAGGLPLKRLSFPRDFRLQQNVYTTIMADLAGVAVPGGPAGIHP
jgi:hypothetical protein